MDLLQFLKMVSVARWVKVSAVMFIVLYLSYATWLVVSIFLGYEDKLIGTGATLLGTTIPLFLLIGFLAFYESGIAPLKRSTDRFLGHIVIDELKANGLDVNFIESYKDGECIGHYILRCGEQGASFRFSLRINVRKAVLVVFVPKSSAALPGNQMPMEFIKNAFAHSLSGALEEGYQLNGQLGEAKVGDNPYWTLVLYRKLPGDFLWNSAEKLYFVHDLAAFLASMGSEGAHASLFAEACARNS